MPKTIQKINIVVPTKSRKTLITVNELRRTGYDGLIYLLVPESEKQLHFGKKNVEIIALPDHYRIAHTRQYACDNLGPKLVMMDDDLRFYERSYGETKADGSVPLRKTDNTKPLLDWLRISLDRYAHVGVSARTQNWQAARWDENQYENQRPYRIYGYRTDVLIQNKITYSVNMQNFTMDDFHMTLNMFEAGYSNAINIQYAQEQINSNSPGGASTYRSLASHEASAKLLHQMHPEYVKLVSKTTKSSWGGTEAKPVTRTDVVIQWGKAYNAADPKPVSPA